MLMRFLIVLGIIGAIWPALFVGPAAAQTSTCAALDPANGGTPADGVTFVTLDLQTDDAVTLTGVGVGLVVLTPAEIAALPPGFVIDAELVAQPTEATNTFVATTAGIHHLGSLDVAGGGASLLEGSFSCAVPAPPPPPTTPPDPQPVVDQMQSQQVASSSIMTRQTAQSIQAGISIALADRFSAGFDVVPPVVVKGYTASAHTSLHDLAARTDGPRQRKLAAYPNVTRADQAIQRAFFAAGSNDVTVESAVQEDATAEQVFALQNLGTGPYPYIADSRLNAWSHGSFTYVVGGATDGHTWSGMFGVDYLLTDQLLVGLLGGYESGRFEFNASNGTFDGEGLTAGAYVGFQMSEQLMLEAYLAHSWLDYRNVSAAVTGSTDASRVLFSANLHGSHQLTNSLILEPNVSVFYAHESQAAYTLSNGAVVGSNTIEGGRVSIGPKLRYLVDGDDTDWSFYVSAHGEYDFSSGVQTNPSLPDFDSFLSGRLGLGVDSIFANGWSASLTGDIGGIGSGDFTSYAIQGKLRIPLN